MRVLIVEDNRLERLAMEKLFSMIYPDVFTVVSLAADGKSALLYLEKYFCELVMLDINLPDISGLDLLEKIKELRPATKCIMVTAYAEFSYLQLSIRRNAFDYLLKPYSKNTLKEALDRFLDDYWKGEQYGSNAICVNVRNYLMDNYTKPLMLQDVADAVGFDKSYIGRVFKKEFGMGVMEYLSKIRIDRAEELISRGMSVSEAAVKVGFDDPAYFGKCFKKLKGFSPKNSGKV